MPKSDKDEIITRIIEILSELNSQGVCTVRELAKITSVTERTIQRDMLVLEKMGIAERNQNQWQLMNENSFYNKIGSIVEKRFIAAYINILKNLPQLQNTVNIIQKGLTYNFDIFKVITEKPMVLTNEQYKTIARLYSFIKNCDKVKFQYARDDNPPETKILSPYKIIYDNGFWYLAGVTENNKNLVKYRLDFIRNLDAATTEDIVDGFVIFTPDKTILRYIDNATSTWFNADEIPVSVELFGHAIDTFQKRIIFNNQKLEEKDGRFFLHVTVANFMDFFSSIAGFMPLFDIISPNDFKEQLSAIIKKYNSSFPNDINSRTPIL